MRNKLETIVLKFNKKVVVVRRPCRLLNVFLLIYACVFVFVFVSVFEEVPSPLDRDLGKWTVPEPLFSPKGVSMKAAPVLSIRRKKMTPIASK